MVLDSMLERFERYGDEDAIVWQDATYSYRWLLDKISGCQKYLRAQEIAAGSVVIIEGDFSPHAVAWFLSLIDLGHIIVPIASSLASNRDLPIREVQGEYSLKVNTTEDVTLESLGRSAVHELYTILRSRNHPGLVVFSSASTGKSKAAVHDMIMLLNKFTVQRQASRTLSFLLFDHLGGINTMLHTLSNGGCLVAAANRSPDHVLAAVETHRVELLPTTPTFLNHVLISEAYKRHSLESLKIISYGTEPMPEITLKRLHELFPHVRLLQTYGLTEVGVLRTRSKSSDSLWIKLDGQGFETRIVDGILQIKAESALLGYLNAPSPLTADGWLNTHDRVETDGDYIRFLGRQSEMINVGGEKVFPAEVENVVQEIDNVGDVVVFGDPNPITGQIVCARVTLIREEDEVALTTRLKKHCLRRLERYKVPIKVLITSKQQHTDRYKKKRCG